MCIYNWIIYKYINIIYIYIYNLTILEWQPRINTPQHRSTRSTRFWRLRKKRRSDHPSLHLWWESSMRGQVRWNQFGFSIGGSDGTYLQGIELDMTSRGLNSNGTSCLIASMRGEIWWNWLQISSRTQWGVNLDETCWELTSTKAQMRSNSMKLVSYEYPWGINCLIA